MSELSTNVICTVLLVVGAYLVRIRAKKWRQKTCKVRTFASRKARAKSIALELLTLYKQQPEAKTLWIGICGVPGAGKTTFASELARELNEHIQTRVVPMDGYHYYRKELDAFADPQEAHRKRGAPFTFNAARFASDLSIGRQAIESKHESAFDPTERNVVVPPTTKIVIVEGNYLLLDDDGWREARQILDFVYFLDVGLPVARHRLALRHAAVWDWPLDRALKRVDESDYLNMLLIEGTKDRADELLLDVS